MEPGIYTVKCEILEVEKATYSQVVIVTEDVGYNILTIFPNWEGTLPEKGDIGYIEFEIVRGGDKYWDKHLGWKCYGYNMTIFRKFVPVTERTENKEIIL
jgi:hypothetical protein